MRINLWIRTIILCWGITSAMIAFAQGSEDRVAFVIGNAAYKGSHALKNPVNDSRAIAGFLRTQGFEVFEQNNLMSAQVGEFRQQLEKRITRNTVLFFYYAGHGVQVDGRNYLAPIDASFNSSESFADESLYLGDVLSIIEKRRPRLGVVILDACRDNPFAHEKSKTTRQGLARVDPPSSTVIFYATRPGGVASDGSGANGLFTQSLLKEFQNRESPLEVVFRRVSSAVYKSSGGEQEPWIEGVIRQEFALAKDSANQQMANPVPSSASAALTGSLPPQQSLPIEKPVVTSVAVAPLASVSTHASAPAETLASLGDVEVKARIRGLKSATEDDLPTKVVCDEAGCFDYQQWVSALNAPNRLETLKGAMQSLIKNEDVRFCIFNPDRFDCENDDPIKMTVIYPLAPIIPRKSMQGFTWKEPRVTNSGGVSFKFAPLTVGGAPGTCIDAEGGLQFARERIDFSISRMTCFNLIVPGSIKQNFQVLMMDLQRKEMIVYWDWNVISFLTYGSGRHLIKVKF